MANKLILCSVGVAVAAGVVFAQQKYKTNKQPWSNYTVHDMQRPHPKKVKSGGAVVVKAPADAVVLFGGKSTDAFTKNWKVRDGVMIASPGDIHTKKKFASCQFHMEWRIPAGRKVNGQSGGNSGVFFMDKYEVQVQESHTNVTYADGQAGAIYGQTPPMVNPSVPQGEWQSYDVIFEAPKYGADGVEEPGYITVIHNGVVIHHRQKLYGPTTHKRVTKYPKKHPEKAPLRFQWHGDPIEFRNIWIREM